MKNDLITSIAIAIFGIIAGYLVCNLFSGESTPFSFYNVDASKSNLTLDDPDPEIFNYRALNPTVEVYVGDCRNFDETGQCIDDATDQIENDIINNDSENNTQDDDDKNNSLKDGDNEEEE